MRPATHRDIERILHEDLEGNQRLIPYADGLDDFDVVWLAALDGEIFWVGEMLEETPTETPTATSGTPTVSYSYSEGASGL